MASECPICKRRTGHFWNKNGQSVCGRCALGTRGYVKWMREQLKYAKKEIEMNGA